VHTLKEITGLSQTAFGGNRNPEESGGIRRNPEESCANTGIPVPQELLQKIPVKWLKTGIIKTPPKPHSCEEIPPEKKGKKEILRNPGRNRFWGSKKRIPENRNRQPSPQEAWQLQSAFATCCRE
jgi:hypothetical protein